MRLVGYLAVMEYEATTITFTPKDGGGAVELVCSQAPLPPDADRF